MEIDLLAILIKNVDRTIFHHNLLNFRICTMVIEAPTPFNRTLRIKMYKNIARSRLFRRIAKRSIGDFLQKAPPKSAKTSENDERHFPGFPSKDDDTHHGRIPGESIEMPGL